jgi:hypothetical protein
VIRLRCLAGLLVALFASAAVPPGGVRVTSARARVIDATTGAPVGDAIITSGGREARTDATGSFALADAAAGVIRVRAAGYLRADAAVSTLQGATAAVRLRPFRPRALYLTVYGIGDRTLRTAALHLIETTEVNALVIDLKGDRGIVPYRSAIPLAAQIGAQRVITIPDLPVLISGLRARGVYTIARIVVFKDDPLASARPELALRRTNGTVYRDREGLAWTLPDNREVWNYNIGLAIEAANAGVDEIQFDYVRLADATGLAAGVPWTAQTRTAAIDGFLEEARRRLTPYNVFLAADVFGYVCWNANDTGIGQQLEHLAGIVDYLSPMLYPSGFQFGIPGYRNPVAHPYQIVRLSLEEARGRTGLAPVHFRPWLQAFRDYAFGGGAFNAGEVAAQIKAAEDFGADGWMLWNPRNRYSAADLPPRAVRSKPPESR